MAIGINYENPEYKEIRFNLSHVKNAKVGDIVQIPKDHRVIGKFSYSQILTEFSRMVAVQAPSDIEKMLIVEIS